MEKNSPDFIPRFIRIDATRNRKSEAARLTACGGERQRVAAGKDPDPVTLPSMELGRRRKEGRAAGIIAEKYWEFRSLLEKLVQNFPPFAHPLPESPVNNGNSSMLNDRFDCGVQRQSIWDSRSTHKGKNFQFLFCHNLSAGNQEHGGGTVFAHRYRNRLMSSRKPICVNAVLIVDPPVIRQM